MGNAASTGVPRYDATSSGVRNEGSIKSQANAAVRLTVVAKTGIGSEMKINEDKGDKGEQKADGRTWAETRDEISHVAPLSHR